MAVPDEDVAAPRTPRDLGRWATGVHRLHAGTALRNVEGRRLTGPQQGFGMLWRRRYVARIGRVATPEHAVAQWREHFAELWPRGNRFSAEVGAALAPGDVAGLSVAAAPGLAFATGVLVLYADERSFTFMTPQGHMFAGWITFGAKEDSGGTVLEIELLIRPNDPLWELAMPVMKRLEDSFWSATLRNLAQHLGAGPVAVAERSVVLDQRYQWANWRNVWHNVGIRSAAWTAATPLRAARRQWARRRSPRV